MRIHRILDATTLSRGVTRWSIAAILALGLPLAYVIAAVRPGAPEAQAQATPQKETVPSATEQFAFDAASIKPANPNLPDGHMVVGMQPPIGGPGTGDPGRIRYPIICLKLLVATAYNLSSEKIVGPDWLATDYFQIDATMPPDTTKDQLLAMLQHLLAERFKLKVHLQTKESPGYSLVVAKSGPKMKESTGPEEPPPPQDVAKQQSPPRPQMDADGFPVHSSVPATGAGLFTTIGMKGIRLTARQQTMHDLAHSLAAFSSRPLSDDTRLTAKYDFTLTFSSGVLTPPDGEPLPDIFSAIQSQLGLKLESKKGSVDQIVVDHMEKTPSGN